MISNPYSESLEQQVLCADPIELVGIMFDHLVASIVAARGHLLSGDRAARGRSIAKALGLLAELRRSLDMARGGEFARTMGQLYEFVADRLVQAQTQQLEQPLIDAAKTLSPLRDGWKELHQLRFDAMPIDLPVRDESICEPGMRFALSA